MFLDDMAFIIRTYTAITTVQMRLDKWCEDNQLKLNMGPNKTTLLHFTNKRTRPNYQYQLPICSNYRYLGKEIRLRSDNTSYLNAWRTSQVEARLAKYKNCMNLFIKAAYVCPESFKQLRHAICSITEGNLYGIADHTTPIYEIYASGALLKWETTLRRTLKRILYLPPSYPTDLLHLITGIPSIATILKKK